MAQSVYDFTAKNSRGDEKSLEEYRGKVLLIVNTASKCGFTGQYDGLEKLYEALSDKGFEILAFPCNQFAGQEPGSDEEIATFCATRFHIRFPVFAKIDVNGKDADPLYEYPSGDQLPRPRLQVLLPSSLRHFES